MRLGSLPRRRPSLRPLVDQAVSRALYEAMILAAPSPGLAMPVARRRGSGVLARPGTDIVIEA